MLESKLLRPKHQKTIDLILGLLYLWYEYQSSSGSPTFIKKKKKPTTYSYYSEKIEYFDFFCSIKKLIIKQTNKQSEILKQVIFNKMLKKQTTP